MKTQRILTLSLYCICLMLLSACGSTPDSDSVTKIDSTDAPAVQQEHPSQSESTVTVSKGTRNNTPQCLIPETPGTVTYGNEVVSIDASNLDKGYICVKYQGTCPKVKFQLTGPDQVTYTYDLFGQDYEIFPLTGGDGTYHIGVYENISGTQYATSFYQELAVALENSFLPFLHPNQYVNFTPESETVLMAQELAASANTDLDVVSNVYNYVISSISYDYDKAQNMTSGYLSDIDETLRSGSGICLDYAALMAAMLRSQGIPTHLEVGYAKDAYHAWISVYVDEKGWINGMIEFNGASWSLLDPTFAANSSEKSLKKFIGDGSNYTIKYVY